MTVPMSLLVAHFLGDFILQSDWMASNKSKRWDALALHVALYAVCFLWWGWLFAVITFALHFAQDAVTSRINSRLYAAGQRHWFFVGIGADQLLHFALLAWTLQIIERY